VIVLVADRIGRDIVRDADRAALGEHATAEALPGCEPEVPQSLGAGADELGEQELAVDDLAAEQHAGSDLLPQHAQGLTDRIPITGLQRARRGVLTLGNVHDDDVLPHAGVACRI